MIKFPADQAEFDRAMSQKNGMLLSTQQAWNLIAEQSSLYFWAESDDAAKALRHLAKKLRIMVVELEGDIDEFVAEQTRRDLEIRKVVGNHQQE